MRPRDTVHSSEEVRGNGASHKSETNLEFLPSETNLDRGVQILEFVLQQMHTTLMAFTSSEANDIVANSRKNPLEAWRKRSFLRTTISAGRCSLLELQAGIERWESYVSRCEKKWKDKLDDEIKFAGLEALVPEELEKHSILNFNRLRTFEDARLESVVTYVEAKFGLRTRDSKPSDTGSRAHSDPLDVDAVNTLSRLEKEKSHRVRVMGIRSAVEHIFNETAMHARAQASNRLARANRASHGPRVSGNPKESPKEPKVRSKVPKAHTRVKHRKLVYQVWNTGNQRQAPKLRNLHSRVTTDNSWFHDGWSYDEWKDDWSLVGWHEGWEQTHDIPQAHFHLGF